MDTNNVRTAVDDLPIARSVESANTDMSSPSVHDHPHVECFTKMGPAVDGVMDSDIADDSAIETDVDMDAEGQVPLTLETLPTEMFLHICSFLDAGFLIHKLGLVCKQFHKILANEQTWRIRQMKLWGNNGLYPPVPVNEDEFPWSRACVKREEQIKLWGNNGSNLQKIELRGHIACVDSVHLFEGGKYMASGSRDRSIIVWDLDKCFGARTSSAYSEGKIDTKSGAHQGWIWSLASNSSHLYSASWDTKIKVWDRKNSFQLVTEYTTKAACLSLSAMENLVSCGTTNKNVFLFDPRNGNQPIRSYKAHKNSVLALGMDENRIISCGEDGRVVCYDIRGNKTTKTFSLPETGAFPTCLSYRRDDPAPIFYLGDQVGNLHLVSMDLNIVHSYEIGHKRSIQGVFHGLGSVFTCSRDGTMKIFEPSLGLKEIASYSIGEELPAVHSLYNTVALADGNGVIHCWSPVTGF